MTRNNRRAILKIIKYIRDNHFCGLDTTKLFGANQDFRMSESKKLEKLVVDLLNSWGILDKDCIAFIAEDALKLFYNSKWTGTLDAIYGDIAIRNMATGIIDWYDIKCGKDHSGSIKNTSKVLFGKNAKSNEYYWYLCFSENSRTAYIFEGYKAKNIPNHIDAKTGITQNFIGEIDYKNAIGIIVDYI